MTKNIPTLDLETYWPYQAVVLANLVSRNTHRLLKIHTGINLSHWRVMAAIGGKPGRTSAEVVAVTPMDKGIVSRSVKFLIETKYVVKKSDDEDKRRAALYLTKKGLAQYREFSKILKASIETNPADDAAFNARLASYIAMMAK